MACWCIGKTGEASGAHELALEKIDEIAGAGSGGADDHCRDGLWYYYI